MQLKGIKFSVHNPEVIGLNSTLVKLDVRLCWSLSKNENNTSFGKHEINLFYPISGSNIQLPHFCYVVKFCQKHQKSLLVHTNGQKLLEIDVVGHKIKMAL